MPLLILFFLLFISCQSDINSDSGNNNSPSYNYHGEFTGYIISNDSINIDDGLIYGAISEYYVDINQKLLEGEILMIYNDKNDTLINKEIEEGRVINDSIFIKIINISDTFKFQGIKTFENHYEGEWFLLDKGIIGKGFFFFEKLPPMDSPPG